MNNTIEADYSASSETVQVPTEIEVDGWIVDTETGERLREVTPEQIPDDGLITEGLALWMMEKIQAESARIKSAELTEGQALDAIAVMEQEALEVVRMTPEYIQAKAIVTNCESIRQKAAKRLESKQAWWKNALSAFALRNLPKNERTWSTPFGSVSFTKQRKTIGITDPKAAVAWLIANGCEDAVDYGVKTSKITKELSREMIDGTIETPEGFVVSQAPDKVQIIGLV
jgi:hypothetical protein